jgi:hypothetical protein
VTFLPLQVLVWILLLKNVELLSEILPWRKCRLAAKICGLILDAGAPLYCFKIVPNTLVSQWMVVDERSQLCILSCFLAILCLQLSHFFSILSDQVIVSIG